jgi:4-amino-4-deoxy-L-arabinose transferase-like glycosyltransferase
MTRTTDAPDRIVIVALLAIHTGLLAWGALRHSPTHDEVGHVIAGISHWEFGQFNLYRVNPPLSRIVATLLLPLLDVRDSWDLYDADALARSEQLIRRDFVRVNGENLFWIHTVARWSILPFAWIGLLMCYRFASELYGRASGLLAATLWCFSPNIIAHAQVVTADAAAASLGIAAGYCYWRWLQRPALRGAVIAGLVLGLAEATKSTWIILFGLWPGLFLIQCLGSRTASRASRQIELSVPTRGAQLLLILTIAIVVLNSVYGFERTGTRLGEFRFASAALRGDADDSSNRFANSWLGQLPIPLPANYIQGIDLQKLDFEREFWSYLGGRWKKGGRWYYYVYAMAIKEPIGTWLLVVFATALSLERGAVRSFFGRGELIVVLVPLAVLALVSWQTGINIGLRYALPAFPFAFVWASKVARVLIAEHGVWGYCVAGCACWSVVSSLSVYPHSLSYFNEMVGGPRNGHLHLADSNTDWGQDLLYVKRWIQRNNIDDGCMAYAIDYIDPKDLGLPVEVPDRLNARPGWHVVSVNELHDQRGDFEYLSGLKPVTMIGYTNLVYYISEDGILDE